MQFSDVVGQDLIKQRLLADYRSGRVPHAQLFCGKEGSGAWPMALAFAQYLLCTGKDPMADVGMFGPAAATAPLDHACGRCPSCLMAGKLQHPDLHLVFPIYKKQSKPTYCDDFVAEFRDLMLADPYASYADWLRASGAQNQQLVIYVEESDAITRKLSLKASQGGYKVCLIWQADKMHEACANKLLKLLEEPPAQTVFILVSERPEHILQTIRSRTQRIDFPPLAEGEMAQALVQRNGIGHDVALRLAHNAEGSFTQALRNGQQDEEQQLYFELFVSLMRLSYARKVKEMRQWSEQVAAFGREPQKAFLNYCQRMVRENFVYNFRRPAMSYMSDAEAQFALKFAPYINERNVVGIMNELSLLQRDIEQNANAKIALFDFALKMIVLIKDR